MSLLTTAARAGATPLPRGLLLGVATAAHQIEGAAGRAESIWEPFCREPGRVERAEDASVACDHVHRWEEDLDLLAELGMETYRFSISWPRVQPDGRGAVDVSFYRRLCEGLLARGIEPVATLYHWDLPEVVQVRDGGWPARATAERFAEYALATVEGLRDVVAGWITLNEPWCAAHLGYTVGRKAPGWTDWREGLRASHHLLLGHGLVAQEVQGAGITLNLVPFRPATDAPEDVAAAHRLDGQMNRWYLDPVLKGAYPADMLELFERAGVGLDVVQDGDMATIAAPLGFVGVNYYMPFRVADDPAEPVLRAVHAPPQGPLTDMGWEVDPDGLRDVLLRVHEDYGAPVLWVTENGAAYPDPPPAGGTLEDPEREAYLRSHLDAVARAAAAGADIRRYHAWSLMDNFEWEQGYRPRFGIVHVDFETQARTPKRSARWYADEIAATREARRG